LRWSPIECCFTAQHANSRLGANSSFATSINNQGRREQWDEEITRTSICKKGKKKQGAPRWFLASAHKQETWHELNSRWVESRGFWVWGPVGTACFSLHAGISIPSCELGEHGLVTPCLLDFTDNKVICSPNYHPLSATSATVLWIHSFFLEHYMPAESRHFQILHQFHQLFISYHV
jgi:hypothetical protein